MAFTWVDATVPQERMIQYSAHTWRIPHPTALATDHATYPTVPAPPQQRWGGNIYIAFVDDLDTPTATFGGVQAHGGGESG